MGASLCEGCAGFHEGCVVEGGSGGGVGAAPSLLSAFEL